MLTNSHWGWVNLFSGGRGGGEGALKFEGVGVVKKRESLPILDLQRLASMIMSVFSVYDNVPCESGFNFFFPLWNFSLSDRKHEL